MTALPLLGWLLAAGLALACAWLASDLRLAWRMVRDQRIEVQEAEAWCEEWRRQAEADCARVSRLETQLKHTEALYAYHVHGTMLALNSRNLLPWMVRNGERKA